ncbi:MAG: hypothetical protein IJ747_09095 [Lachnospiraceae bacterium]|nr:hypothetical protein [Lachnospiraceae bacterium]
MRDRTSEKRPSAKRIWVWGLAILWSGLMLATVGGVTYAWFTFNSATNVEPMSSTVSSSEIALMISNDPAGEFGIECALPQSVKGDLQPLSTADLERFYRGSGQNRQGITVTYRDATDLVEQDTIHGEVYLKSLDNPCNVYLYRPGMNFGEDAQMLAALRLGMRITTVNGTNTYIFALNDMGSTAGASSRQTTARTDVVVSSISGSGTPNYVEDPAREMGSYFAVPPTSVNERPKPGNAILCSLEADEVAKVEYWLYMEGCDAQCVNAAQDRAVSLQLSFAGTRVTE